MAKPPKEAYDLTDAEKRDLIQLIQQGKALPEKYRFITQGAIEAAAADLKNGKS